MTELYRNKYRVKSIRKEGWDYGWNAAYFVTICTRYRLHFFGEVIDGEMVLNEVGKVAHDCWLQIPEQFPYARLENHIIMPNHIHGIVIIDKPDTVETRLIASPQPQPESTPEWKTDMGLIASPQPQPLDSSKEAAIPGGITGEHNPMLRENLSRIIRWYKGRVSFEARKVNPGFEWQTRFHDHIIRDDKSFRRISEYIQNNPSTWAEDSLR